MTEPQDTAAGGAQVAAGPSGAAGRPGDAADPAANDGDGDGHSDRMDESDSAGEGGGWRLEGLAMAARVREALEDVAARGLRAAAARELATLEALRDEACAAGMTHVARRLGALADAARGGDDRAGAALMEAYASLRVLERLLTLEACEHALAEALASAGDAAGGGADGDDASTGEGAP